MPYTDLQLATAFIQAGELDDALEALDRHLSGHATDEDARRMRARVRARVAGQQAGALADFDALPAHTPEDTILQSSLLLDVGRPDDALAVVADAHRHYPTHARLTERYVGLLRDANQLEKARAIVSTQPADDWRWRSRAGDLAVAAGDEAAALEQYAAAITLLDDRYNLSALTGAATLNDASFAQMDNISEAAALTVEVEYARLLLARAGVNLRLGNMDAAEADYVQAAVILPDDVTILFFRGLIAHQRGDDATARRLCNDGLAGVRPAVREQLLAAAPAAIQALIED